MKKVILVTGASSGMGLACAKQLHAEGHIVYGSSRNVNKLSTFPFKPVTLDVTDDASVKLAYDTIIQAEGRLDVLINNAGVTFSGPAFAASVDAARQQMDTNYFGVLRMSNAVLPAMIARKQGLVINISSMAGLFGLPYQGLYCASKYAVEGYTESLRMELRRTGVHVVLINPGDYRTNYTASRHKLPFTLNDVQLQSDYTTTLAAMERTEGAAPTPERMAKKVAGIVARSKHAYRYLAASLVECLVPLVRTIVPRRMFDVIIRSYYNI